MTTQESASIAQPVTLPYFVDRVHVPDFEPYAQVYEVYSTRDQNRGAFSLLRRIATESGVDYQFVSSVGINDPRIATSDVPESFFEEQQHNYDGGEVRYSRALTSLQLGLPYLVQVSIDLFEAPHHDRGYARFTFDSVNDSRVVRDAAVSKWVRPREASVTTYQHLAQQTESLLRNQGIVTGDFHRMGHRESFDPDAMATFGEL